MDVQQIQELIRVVAKAGVTEVSLEQGDFKITIKTQGEAPAQQVQQVYHVPAQAPQQQVAAPAPQAAAPAAPAAPVADTTITIKSPMIGTFYQKPSPDKEAFVKVGDKITKGQVVCVIEAMKLFNEIESEVSGTIVKILVNDTTPVEYDQPLFILEP